MSGTFENLGRYIDDGIREFSQHPVSYTAHAVGSLVKDYYDLAAAAAGGALLARSLCHPLPNRDMLDGLALYVVVPALAHKLHNEDWRMLRNIAGGGVAAALTVGTLADDIDAYFMALIPGAATVMTELENRNARKQRQQWPRQLRNIILHK